MGATVSGFGGNGILLYDVAGCQIGSAAAAGQSVTVVGDGTAGMDRAGIRITGSAAVRNTILASYVGTDANSAANLGNKADGILIDGGASFNTIGGTGPGETNLISNNGRDGIRINGAGAGNTVFGNFIGTNKNGNAKLGNAGAGVNVVDSASTIIGGQVAVGAGGVIVSPANLISGNGGAGIAIGGPASTNCTVQGNFIGTSKTGLQGLGNTGIGIALVGNSLTYIGAAQAGSLNVISANGGDGIGATGSSSNWIVNNSIGRGPDKGNAAVVLPNGPNGITFNAASTKNNVKGTTIAKHTGKAVNDLMAAPSTNKVYDPNSIVGNGYGIYHVFGLLNTPTLTSAVASPDGSAVDVAGYLQGAAPSTSFALEFFGNLVAERQGDQYLGTLTVSTDSAGNASFSTTLTTAYGKYITATSTDPFDTGFTSEFSVDQAISYTTSTILTSSVNPSVYGQSVSFTATVTPQAPASAGIPTGSVTFYDGSTALGTVKLDANGQASYTTALLLAGSHAITAVYNPEVDPNFATSTSAVLTQGVGKGTTGDPLQFSPGNPVVGQTITFSGYISAGTVGVAPTGTVTLTDQNGNTLAGGVPLDQYGYFSVDVSGLAAGSYTVTATYGGDGNYNGNSAGVVSFTVTGGGTEAVRSGGLAPSSVSLTGSASSVSAGQAVTLTAAVTATGAAPVGWVVLYDGDIRVGTARIDGSGHVSFRLSGLPIGTHHLAAVYMGDASHARSAAAAFTLTVR